MAFGFLLLAASALQVAALPPLPDPAPDGYVLEQYTRRYSRVRVQIIRYKSYEQLNESLGHKIEPDGMGIVGYTEWQGDRCIIRVIDERVAYRPEVLGHEMTHCLAGDFHPTQPRKLP